MNEMLLKSIVGIVLLFIPGKFIFDWRGKILALLQAIDEFLDIIIEVTKAAEDKKISATEWKKIKHEAYEFKLALDRFRGMPDDKVNDIVTKL